MLRPIQRRFLFIPLVLIIVVLFSSGKLLAVPHLKDIAKKNSNTSTTVSSKKVSTKRVIRPRIVGKYKDISAVKKRNKRYAKSSRSKKSKGSKKLRYLSSRSAIIVDGVSGRTLYAKNPNSPRQPASTIKVLTGMIALKSLKKDDTIPVSRKAARQPRSKIYLDQQKKYKAHDLINAVLLASANDASVALAEKIAGSEKSFARMMTLRANLWGAKQTICKTATGLTAKGQKSTARDLAIIFRHAMRDREFASRMKRTKVRTSGGKLLRNHNKALWQVNGTLGGKTGYTNAARQTYVGKFKRGNDELIIAIMGSEQMWTDIKKLVEYGFSKKQALASAQESGSQDIVMTGMSF